MQKTVPNNYFHFTRKERNAILILLILVGIISAIPFIAGTFQKENISADDGFPVKQAIRELKQEDSFYQGNKMRISGKPNHNYGYNSEKKFQPESHELFRFDPNTLPEEGWRKLGVKEKTIAVIQHYLSKGGKFRKADDIKKIWGMNQRLSETLLPYVQIREAEEKPAFYKAAAKADKENQNFEIIDINSADTSAWISLPGIGSRLANRIVGFREKLGGFYKVEQVGETYGLPDSVFSKIRLRLKQANESIKKININTATFDELKEHPYIRYKLAGLMIQYRNQHGSFKKKEDVMKIMAISEELYEKLEPYLVVD